MMPAVLSALLILGSIFGTVLHAVLWLLIRRRTRKRAGERVFSRLVLAGLVFNFGIFASVFVELFLRKRASPLCNGLESVSLIALACMPSLLLHNFLAFYRPRWLEGGWPILLYLPSLTMITTIDRLFASPDSGLLEVLASPIRPFLIWTITAVLASSYIAFAMFNESPTGREATSNRTIGSLLLYVTLLLTTALLFAPYDIPLVGSALKLLALLSPNLLAFVFAYSVYRYNYLGYFMKAGAFHTMLAAFSLSIYFFGIRWIGESLERHYDIDFRVLEAGLVLALLFAFGPLKEALERMANLFFFKDITRASERIQSLSSELSAAPFPSLERTMERVCQTLKEVFASDSSWIVLMGEESQEFPRAAMRRLEIPPALLELVQQNPSRLIGTEEVAHSELAQQMDDLRISWVIPLSKDAGLIGLLILGNREVEAHLTPDERDLLLMLSNQITMVVEKHRILEQMISLERKVSETDKLSSLGRLAASVAHEIKNPLSSIKAIIQAAREDTQMREPLSDDLAVVVEEIDRLDETVNRLLNYIRPQMSREKLVPVEGILEGVLDILRYEAEKRKVTFVKGFSKDMHYIRGRAEDLKSILFNLVLNGLEAMDQGGVLTVSSLSLKPEREGDDASRKWVQITVEDTGCGISPADMEHLFEPFRTSKEGGTGLGLAIAKQKVDELGGTIRVESNEGTRFTIELPVLGRR